MSMFSRSLHFVLSEYLLLQILLGQEIPALLFLIRLGGLMLGLVDVGLRMYWGGLLFLLGKILDGEGFVSIVIMCNIEVWPCVLDFFDDHDMVDLSVDCFFSMLDSSVFYCFHFAPMPPPSPLLEPLHLPPRPVPRPVPRSPVQLGRRPVFALGLLRCVRMISDSSIDSSSSEVS